jgi:hypothetical protein
MDCGLNFTAKNSFPAENAEFDYEFVRYRKLAGGIAV